MRSLAGAHNDPAPEFVKRWNRFGRPTGQSWRVDENYLKPQFVAVCQLLMNPPSSALTTLLEFTMSITIKPI